MSLDLFHLPPATGPGDVQIFASAGSVNGWSVWNKPRGKTMLYALVIGGGTSSYISLAPNTGDRNLITSSGVTPAGGGGTGTGAAVGAAGTQGSALTVGSHTLSGLCQINTIAGQNGVAGGAVAGAIGTAITIPSTMMVCAGSGGAGTTSADFAGGIVTPIASSWLSEQAAVAQAAGSFDGTNGRQLWEPFFSFGGQGGSSSNAGVGGHGGHGAHGAGGGGGGAGTTGGTGGNGGNGIVVIICW